MSGSQHGLLRVIILVIVDDTHPLNLHPRRCVTQHSPLQLRTALSVHEGRDLVCQFGLVSPKGFHYFVVVDVCVAQGALVCEILQFGAEPLVDALRVEHVLADRDLPHWRAY